MQPSVPGVHSAVEPESPPRASTTTRASSASPTRAPVQLAVADRLDRDGRDVLQRDPHRLSARAGEGDLRARRQPALVQEAQQRRALEPLLALPHAPPRYRSSTCTTPERPGRLTSTAPGSTPWKGLARSVPSAPNTAAPRGGRTTSARGAPGPGPTASCVLVGLEQLDAQELSALTCRLTNAPGRRCGPSRPWPGQPAPAPAAACASRSVRRSRSPPGCRPRGPGRKRPSRP